MKKQRFLGRRSPTSRIIHFPSIKCNELKYCESRLEYDRLLQLEFDPYVKYYEAQPDPIFYTNDKGKEVRYTPDLKVVAKFGDSFVIEEVKPYEISIKEKVVRKHALIASVYDDSLIPFKIVTEKEIYLGQSNVNHRKFYRYLSEPVPQLVKEALKGELSSFEGSVTQLRDQMIKRNFPFSNVMLLIAHGLVKFDFEHEFNLETKVARHE